MKMNF